MRPLPIYSESRSYYIPFYSLYRLKAFTKFGKSCKNQVAFRGLRELSPTTELQIELKAFLTETVIIRVYQTSESLLQAILYYNFWVITS